MAVPKKRTSKTKKNIRKSVWKNKTTAQALKAVSVGKSNLKKAFLEESSEIRGFSKRAEESNTNTSATDTDA